MDRGGEQWWAFQFLVVEFLIKQVLCWLKVWIVNFGLRGVFPEEGAHNSMLRCVSLYRMNNEHVPKQLVVAIESWPATIGPSQS